MERIEDTGTLEAAFATERFLLFKHSTVCPISAGAYGEYQERDDSHCQQDAQEKQIKGGTGN